MFTGPINAFTTFGTAKSDSSMAVWKSNWCRKRKEEVNEVQDRDAKSQVDIFGEEASTYILTTSQKMVSHLWCLEDGGSLGM